MKKPKMKKNNNISIMKTKNITINIPEGYDDVKFNEKTHEIEFVKKDSKPRSWKEYCENVKYTPCYMAYLGHPDGLVDKSNRRHMPCVCEFNTEEEAKAFMALGKLIQLRDAWWGDWTSDWNDASQDKYVIYFDKNEICVAWYCRESRILAFPTKEMRDDFLETFRDLIEEAKMLL